MEGSKTVQNQTNKKFCFYKDLSHECWSFHRDSHVNKVNWFNDLPLNSEYAVAVETSCLLSALKNSEIFVGG